MYMGVCLYAWLCTTHILGPLEAGNGCQSSWSWSYGQLGVTMEEQPVLLTWIHLPSPTR